MKKLFAILLAVMLLLSLAACGEKENNPSGSNTDKPGVSQNGNNDNEENPGTSQPDNNDNDVPVGVSVPTDKYPFLAGLVLPDDAVVTEVDDEYYSEDKEISMIVKPMTPDKVTAYEQKLADAGYTDEGINGLLSPDGKFYLVVDDGMIDLGYISLAIFEVTE